VKNEALNSAAPITAGSSIFHEEPSADRSVAPAWWANVARVWPL
jgi:hypothetical protein